jgi:hypothetical protein
MTPNTRLMIAVVLVVRAGVFMSFSRSQFQAAGR